MTNLKMEEINKNRSKRTGGWFQYFWEVLKKYAFKRGRKVIHTYVGLLLGELREYACHLALNGA